MSNTHTDPTELTARLTALMVEAINHPQSDYILRDLAQELHNADDLEGRMSSQLVRKLATLTQHACASAEDDHAESSDFYEKEADYKHSDLIPADAKQSSNEFGKAAEAYAKCFEGIHKTIVKLNRDLKASGI
jgi:hypothetical protein